MDTTGTSGSLLSPPWTLVGHAGALDAGLASRPARPLEAGWMSDRRPLLGTT